MTSVHIWRTREEEPGNFNNTEEAEELIQVRNIGTTHRKRWNANRTNRDVQTLHSENEQAKPYFFLLYLIGFLYYDCVEYIFGVLLHNRSSEFDPRSSEFDPRSSRLDPRSSNLDPESFSILNPRSSGDPRSCRDPRSWILLRSSILRRSSILDPENRFGLKLDPQTRSSETCNSPIPLNSPDTIFIPLTNCSESEFNPNENIPQRNLLFARSA